jgi:hypothetical protein
MWNPIHRILAITGLAFVLVGCAALQPDSQPNWGETDLLSSPQLLLNPTFDPQSVTLGGVRLGDDESVIDQRAVQNRTAEGWLRLRNRQYRVMDGKVVTLGLWDARALATFQIESPEQIEEVFGRPAEIVDVRRVLFYRYPNRGVTVMWNTFERKVSAINVMPLGFDPATQPTLTYE